MDEKNFIKNAKSIWLASALSESEKQLPNIFQNLPNVAVQSYDSNGLITYSNPASEKYFGINEIEVGGKAISDLIFPTNGEINFSSLLEEIKNSLEPYGPVEMEINDKNGNPKWFVLTILNIQRNKNAQSSFICMFLDIDERKRKKTQLSEKQFEEISKKIPGVIYQLKMSPQGDFSIPYAIGKTYEYLDVTPEDVLYDASLFFEKVHPDDYEDLIRSTHDSAKTLQNFECEFRVVPKNMPSRWLYGIASPEKCEDGSVLWHGLLIDITKKITSI